MNVVSFGEYGCVLLKLTESDKLVKYKISRSEVLIYFFEIIIKDKWINFNYNVWALVSGIFEYFLSI